MPNSKPRQSGLDERGRPIAEKRAYLHDSLDRTNPNAAELLRKTPEERIIALRAEAVEVGIPERYAAVLARIAVRRGVEVRVSYLLNKNGNYSAMVKSSAKMWSDTYGFFTREKVLKRAGGKRFVRYGNLSYAYGNASQVQLVNRLVKDALFTRDNARELRKMARAFGDSPPRPYEEFDADLFHSRREEELETAFRFDLRVNGIDNSLVEAILTRLRWGKVEAGERADRSVNPTKLMIMDSFYAFFTSEEGDSFLGKWKMEGDRPKLLESFLRAFYNEPRVNPHLIGGRAEDIGTPEFEKRRQRFFDSTTYTHDGKEIRRGDREMRILDPYD